MNKENIKISENGLFVRGMVMSSRAKYGERKDDGAPFVIIVHEIYTESELVLWDQFCDPKERTDIVIKEGEVTSFPRIANHKTVVLKVGKAVGDGKRPTQLKNCELVSQI